MALQEEMRFYFTIVSFSGYNAEYMYMYLQLKIVVYLFVTVSGHAIIVVSIDSTCDN